MKTYRTIAGLNSIFCLCLCAVCMLIVSCANPEHSPETWKSRIQQELPLGSSKADVTNYLKKKGIALTENVPNVLPDGSHSDRVFKRSSAMTEIPDTFLFSNRKLIFEFFFDYPDKLVHFTVTETYAFP